MSIGSGQFSLVLMEKRNDSTSIPVIQCRVCRASSMYQSVVDDQEERRERSHCLKVYV